MLDKEKEDFRGNECFKSKNKRKVSPNRSESVENRLSMTGDIVNTNGSMITINDLNNDVLLIIFSHLNFKQQFCITGVCNRWRNLIHWAFTQKKSLSFVNNRKNLLEWTEDIWYEIVDSPKEFIRTNFEKMSDLVLNIISFCPNIRSLDIECYNIDTNTMRLIALKCPKLERINFDSSDGFNIRLSQFLFNSFSELKILNLSCCSHISEEFVHKIVQSLPNLIALNVCGTKITGLCLSLLDIKLKHLNISYCWNLEVMGLMALSQANCLNLRELSINNFNFESSEANDCLEAICNAFRGLKYLDMSFGPCTGSAFYLNSLNFRGFSAIGRLKHLETLIIRKVCILDDTSLQAILFGCRLLKKLVIDMYCESSVTDISISLISQYCTSLESLEISNNFDITGQTIIDVIRKLPHLTKLFLRFLNIRNSVPIFAVKNCPKLRQICLNGCRRITKISLINVIENAKSNPLRKFEFSALKTGILSSMLMNGKKIKIKNIPNNIVLKVSHWRANYYVWFDSKDYCYTPIPNSI